MMQRAGRQARFASTIIDDRQKFASRLRIPRDSTRKYWPITLWGYKIRKNRHVRLASPVTRLKRSADAPCRNGDRDESGTAAVGV